MVAAITVTIALLNGCAKSTPTGGSAAPATSGTAKSADPNKTLTLAVIPKSTGGEFWETVEQGAGTAAKEVNATIKWEGALTETDIAEQNKIIENMINLGVDGIALAPLNPKAMAKSVEAAAAAGIPVVIFDSAVDGNKHISFVATDNAAGGGLGAKYLIDNLPADKRRVAMLRFIQGTASTEDRARGFNEAMKAANIKVLADAYPEDATVAGCKKTATNMLEGFVQNGKLQLDGVFAGNLTATLGLAAALDDLRKSGVAVDVIFCGFDSSPRLVEELQSGNINALVVQNPKKMGYLAVQTLAKHLRGEKVDSRIDTGVQVVTAERLKNEPEIRELVGL
jgi:ribose transport system substrate-binding protein